MSIHATRPFLAPMALAAVGALTLTPAVVTPAHLPAPPTVQVSEIALTGIGQDIYYAITPAVQYAVGGVSYLINFIPIIGGPIAAQININYFQAVQPVVEATVNYLAAVVQNPLDFIGATTAYGATLYDIGYNWVSAEAVFFGLPPLPPLPPTAASVTAPTRPARGAVTPGAAAAVATPTSTAAERPTRPERQGTRPSIARPAAATAGETAHDTARPSKAAAASRTDRSAR